MSTKPTFKRFRNRNALLATLLVAASSAFALALTELALRWHGGHVQASDKLDPGMMLYDAQLGWRLAPNWTGNHHHYDFDVTYTTNEYGYRGEFPLANAPEEVSRVAVMGDSFTFGLGVDNGETFVDLLNREAPDQLAFMNFGTPGYSTDQQLLQLQQRVYLFNPDVVILVAYLGNDLIDNQLPFPVQADNPKPYFELEDDRLQLRNVPVPQMRKPVEDRRRTLSTEVLGGEVDGTSGLFARLLDLRLVQRLGLGQPPAPGTQAVVERRAGYSLRLFAALITQARDDAQKMGAEFVLVTLPGRSYLADPAGVSAIYQESLRQRIQGLAAEFDVELIDLGSELRNSNADGKNGWYHPYEGHLTTDGHRMIAGILAAHQGWQPNGVQP